MIAETEIADDSGRHDEHGGESTGTAEAEARWLKARWRCEETNRARTTLQEDDRCKDDDYPHFGRERPRHSSRRKQ